MIKLGFNTAILPELPLEDVVNFAAAQGFACIEVMCWPVGKAERRYAGVTHIDVAGMSEASANQIGRTLNRAGVAISALGYYPNYLVPDHEEAQVYIDHLKQVIVAAKLLGLDTVNTFVGRDWTQSVDENWPRFKEVWIPLVAFAEEHGIRIGIENCPMAFTSDEWPGGKNLATTPAIWRRMYRDIPSSNFGLNFDPSHFIWQLMDYVKPLREFAPRLFHIHAKDARLDRQRLDEVGIMATPLEFHTPKLPGLGDVDWRMFFSVLTDVGYDGAVCIEAEDRAYERSLEDRKSALIQARRFLLQFVP